MMERFQTIRFDTHTRIVITALFLVVALILTAVGVLVVRIDRSEAEEIMEQLQEEFSQLDTSTIFGNNLIHTLIMFVPIIGPIWGCFVLFNTGTIISVIGIAEGVSPILVFLLLFLTPVFWLEFGVYSIAMAQSTILLWQMLRRRGKKEGVRTCILVTVCALILLLAAIVESIMIYMSNG